MPSYFILFYFLIFLIFIYFINYLFLAVSGLSCDTRDLRCSMRDLSLQCVGFSLVVARGLQSAWAQ